ncbi:MAG TPA: hypothetical protein DEE98_08385 [Elusimicrobia bacterium]|nr:MAG: hypothetical protein A2278_09025 [Elusimicrobia bacterium RIFOXYA12_FULL_49_49]OGS10277.1 MAG: hypothetical protein A2204_08010 [Elusimicrobia bacterium RIFOXYA1_FULL_47_7]OGS11917.1 MAG: hypothetical protein A2386_08530 [Elusimicrobia bacterium RIFOXYB1_FULL_48_9]OGS14928.1 MAG: hypothetical protein A2251_07880 [Elusimicrobia bacterium RIFOXYA2_FULL_47_53]OGS26137.1 MAG: hypothetical protein A2339_02395 [Elusimicrobia bacterium RIFOXYB12_FULL_50_12]OGS29273.1 MAG: hypothetical protein
MKILKTSVHKGKIFVSGKMVHAEKDILNKEDSFESALNTLMVIREERENLFNDKTVKYLEKTIHGKRKAG